MDLYDKRFDYIKEESDIVASFKEDGYELFEQNTTHYSDSESCIIKLKNKEQYYKVTVNVTMVGSWQDVGDKLYTIESIDSVIFEEVPYSRIASDFNKYLENRIASLKNEINSLEAQVISLD